MLGERGHTILLATILGIVAFSAWALAFLTTRDLVRTEKIVRHRDERDQSVTRALGRGIYLMRTGLPPNEPYECVVTLDRDDRTYDCTVRFEQEPGTDTWTVTASRSTEEEIGILPPAPERFIPIGGDSDGETGAGDEAGEDDANEGGDAEAGGYEAGGDQGGSTKSAKEQAKEDRTKAKADKEEAKRDAEIAKLRQQIEDLEAELETKPEPKKSRKKTLEKQLKKAEKALEKLLE